MNIMILHDKSYILSAESLLSRNPFPIFALFEATAQKVAEAD